MRNLTIRHIHIPARYWTAVSIDVFNNVLPHLEGRHSARVYFVLYDLAWHQNSKRVRASFAALAKRTGLDYRVVQQCITELEMKGFIRRTRKGVPHSNEDLPKWRVPAAEFDMKSQGWVPVPSFIFEHYIPCHSACVLLPVLLYFQNMSKQNVCWPGVPKLGEVTNFSEERIFAALHLLGNMECWRSLGSGLPRPLEITQRPTASTGFLRRYFSVRGVYYKPGDSGRSATFHISPKFARRFGIDVKSSYSGPA